MKTLTPNQCAWLRRIDSTGVTWNALFDLRGRARNYAARYRQSLQSAIDAHNRGTASNSPLPRDARIVEGSVGPRGGAGVRLEREPIIEAAEEALRERIV